MHNRKNARISPRSTKARPLSLTRARSVLRRAKRWLTSSRRNVYLVESLCQTVGLPDVDHVLEMRSIEVEGFDVRLDHFETDESAIYLNFDYGTVTAGRMLTVFRLMLEANLLIYAQDQAQLGLNAETGGIVLVVRVQMTDDLDGEMLAEPLSHYAEHGHYWQNNIVESTDDARWHRHGRLHLVARLMQA
jgi:hypothetical protein